jgi:hypothetical protein
VSLDTLTGSACTRADGGAGSVQVTVASDNTIRLVCGPVMTWCAAHTPATGPHLQVSCDEATRTLAYTCDDGWQDADQDPADGCERTTADPTPIEFSGEAGFALSRRLSNLGTPTIDVAADCAAATRPACPDGTPADPLPTMTIDTTTHPADQPRAEVAPVHGTTRFDITQRLRLVTVDPIPITLPLGGACGLRSDTRNGPNPDLTLTYTDTVAPDHPAGPTVVSSPPTVSGLSLDDVTVVGDFSCQAVTVSLSTFTEIVADVLTPWAQDVARVCGAPEPDYFQTCA